MPANRSPQYLHRRLAVAVRARRHAVGISQEELADRAGLHRTYVGAIERGERNPTLATLEALAAGLKMDASKLIVP